MRRPQAISTAAHALYEKAAARGSADGAINLAVALMSGQGIEKNVSRAAAAAAHRLARGGLAYHATYDLGVLSEEGAAGKPADALDFFRQSSSLGDPRGYLASAIVLDEGRGVAKDPAAAAEERCCSGRRGRRRIGHRSIDGQIVIVVAGHDQGRAGPAEERRLLRLALVVTARAVAVSLAPALKQHGACWACRYRKS